MEIWVEFNEGRLTYVPDPARVKKDAPVKWRFRSEASQYPILRWVVFFRNGTPFHGNIDEFVADTVLSGDQHAGSTDPLSAARPGDYKYGIRVETPENEQTLCEDDPYLQVSP